MCPLGTTSFTTGSFTTVSFAAACPMVVVLFYLLTQMAGAGGLIALLLDISTPIGQAG